MQNYFITSIPKAGTHLLSTLAELASGTPFVSVKEKLDLPNVDFSHYRDVPNLVGHYRVAQLRANESLAELFRARKALVMVRDPRDVCNSMLHYLFKSQHPYHVETANLIRGLEYDQQIMAIANGLKAKDHLFEVPNIRKWCVGFVEVRKVLSGVEVFRYEDFFDPQALVPQLMRTFEVNENQAVELIDRSLSGKSKTKREGGAVPEQWREQFSPSLVKFFSDNYSDLILSLGYKL